MRYTFLMSSLHQHAYDSVKVYSKLQTFHRTWLNKPLKKKAADRASSGIHVVKYSHIFYHAPSTVHIYKPYTHVDVGRTN